MAVYTQVDAATAATLLRDVGAGTLRAMEGCASGIENTNYFVHSDTGDWVLTVFERLRPDQLPFYLGLMRHLARKGLPVPEPRADAAGSLVHVIAGKPASLVDLLPGRSVDEPTPAHCAQLGTTLAHLHDAAFDFPLRQPNLRGLAWWEATIPVVEPLVDSAIVALLEGELAFQRAFQDDPATRALPAGAVHADLFRDNALFDGPPGAPHLSGVFDFYFAGFDHHAYDLAVCLNDWCVDLASGALDERRAHALVAAYHAARPMSAAEVRALPGMRRAAALRFWLSRLADWYLPREAALLRPKDPTHFERVLADCIANPWHDAP
jgi:homoserine kinase type II